MSNVRRDEKSGQLKVTSRIEDAALVQRESEFYPNSENSAIYNRLNEEDYKNAQRHFDPILKPLSVLVA